jgi:hypothetical protein
MSDEYTESAQDVLQGLMGETHAASITFTSTNSLPLSLPLPLPLSLPLSESQIDLNPEKKEEPLFGQDSRGAYENQKETYAHRLIATLLAQGLTNKEIAELTGRTQANINYLAKQPFVMQQALKVVHGSSDAAMALLQKESLAAAERLIVIAKNAKNEEVKRKANNDILDRKYGKPNQPYSVRQATAKEMNDDELAKIAFGNS